MESSVNQHNQTMNTFYKLEDMNLGLKELKQLLNTILEIKISNNISPDTNPVSKFHNSHIVILYQLLTKQIFKKK